MKNTHNFHNKSSGFTLVELLVVIVIVLIFFGFIASRFNLTQMQQKQRDDKRLNDMNTIERAILEYRTDMGIFPDVAGTARMSNTDPNPTRISNGWIKADLARYNSYLPVDPLNNETYYYTYIHNGTGYEINCVLEYLIEKAQNDNGNNSAVYETGSNLSLL